MSGSRLSQSVTVEEDNCCGCNVLAIRRHFLDRDLKQVHIVYTSCHDAVSNVTSRSRAEVSAQPTSWLLSFEGFSVYGKQSGEGKKSNAEIPLSFVMLLQHRPRQWQQLAAKAEAGAMEMEILYEQQEAK